MKKSLIVFSPFLASCILQAEAQASGGTEQAFSYQAWQPTFNY